MPSYLYQARVSGIQAYITATGKLKEIVGGSELIEQMCTQWLLQCMKEATGQRDEDGLILGAAGKIEYHFRDEATCRAVLREFPLFVARQAPGLQIAQAVVACAGEQPTRQEIEDLEDRLAAQEQQMAARPLPGLMIAHRASRTGGAVQVIDEPLPAGEVRDPAQHRKIKASEGHGSLFKKILAEAYDHYAASEAIEQHRSHVKQGAFALEMEDMLRGETGWLAVVHADGNRLGQQIDQAMGIIAQSQPKRLLDFRQELSHRLEAATVAAVQEAFARVIEPQYKQEVATEQTRRKRREAAGKPVNKRSVFLPLRPIVLGGDDLTLVMRGELALPFTAKFLESFALQTQSQFAPLVKRFNLTDLDLAQGLTATAGLAYIKYNYPFHYGLSLAESLCRHAKQVGRDIGQGQRVPAGLAFHKVQSSFVEDYEQVRARELVAGPSEEQQVLLDGGPYFLDPQPNYSTLSDLAKWVSVINQSDAPKGNLREWLILLATQPAKAKQVMDRIRVVSQLYVSKLALQGHLRDLPATLPLPQEAGTIAQRTHLHDILSLSSIHSGS